jgi:hypothetical protein
LEDSFVLSQIKKLPIMLKMNIKNQKTVFWTMTVLISAFFILRGYFEVTKNPATYPKTIKIGYPPYFITLLDCAKLIGSAVFLIPAGSSLKGIGFCRIYF